MYIISGVFVWRMIDLAPLLVDVLVWFSFPEEYISNNILSFIGEFDYNKFCFLDTFTARLTCNHPIRNATIHALMHILLPI